MSERERLGRTLKTWAFAATSPIPIAHPSERLRRLAPAVSAEGGGGGAAPLASRVSAAAHLRFKVRCHPPPCQKLADVSNVLLNLYLESFAPLLQQVRKKLSC
jgi:hypothetical protein